MPRPFFALPFICFVLLILPGCNAFKHGYTWNKAVNQYHLVRGDGNSFGDKRLDYNKNFHHHSALADFLNCNCNNRGLPGFIYEYQTPAKCRGIKLYYPSLDSVFVFEEPKKGKLQSVLKESRKMADDERVAFEKLKK